MLLIIIGLALVMLDIAIAPGGAVGVLELLPDFIGYGLVLFGIRREKEHGIVFRKAMLISLCAAVVSAILYGMKALNMMVSAAMTILLLEIFELILMIVLVFMVVRAFRELEQDLQKDLKGKPLLFLSIGYTATVVVAYASQMVTEIARLVLPLMDILAMVILYLLYTNYQSLKEE